MKDIFRSSIHTGYRSHDCLITEIKGKKVKITYEAYNTQEKCNTEIFDGYKWNHILSMLDMGIEPNSSAYVMLDEYKRKKQADSMFKKAKTMCEGIID